MSSQDKPSWKVLEELVADIHTHLLPNARVVHDAKLLGIDSETERQIDVLIEQDLGPHSVRIVVDCKDHKTPVDVKGIEEFAGLVHDVRAHSGAMVCPAGFSSSAKKRAKKLNISLFIPIDIAGGHHWSKPLSLSCLCVVRRGGLGIEIGYDLPLPLRLPTDFAVESLIYDDQGAVLGTPFGIAGARWDAGELPLEVGNYEEIPLIPDGRPTFIENGYGTRVQVQLKVLVEVTEVRYFGKLPFSSMRGLQDEHTGRITSNAFTSGTLSPKIVASEWQRIREGEATPTQAALTVQALEAWQLPRTPIRGKWITVRPESS